MLKAIFTVFTILTLTADVALSEAESPAPNSSLCKSIDNSASLGPVRAQKDIPWCFAYAAADLVTQAIDQRVSAVAAGQTYYNGTNTAALRKFMTVRQNFLAQGRAGYGEDAYEALAVRGKKTLDSLQNAFHQPVESEYAGWVRQSIDYMGKYGICLEADVPSDGGFESKTLSAAQLRTSVELAQRTKNEAGKTKCPPGADDGLVSAGQVSQTALNQEINKNCKVYLPALGFRVHQVDVPTPYKVAHPLPSPLWQPPQVATEDTKKTALASLDEALDGGKIAAIYYNSQLLTGAHPKPGSPAPQEHASSIVARRCDSSCRCTYQLRNSWSQDACKSYSDEFKNRCTDGNVWLTADEVMNNVHSVIWIE